MTFEPKTYFRGSLLLPIVVPLLFLPFIDVSMISAILLGSMVFGGLAYLIFAGVMFWWLGKLKTTKGMKVASYISPILFVPVQGIIWLISFYIQKASQPTLVGGWEGLPMFAIYILAIGYSYVVLVNVFYWVLCKAQVLNVQPNTP